MAALIAVAVGMLLGSGTYLVLRGRTFPVIVGLVLLSYGVNLFLLAMGRLSVRVPPIVIAGQTQYADPLPQALVLTAIVIGFGMTAFIVALALRSYIAFRSDTVVPGGPEA
jgi:multicomponent K+:H+ antiporter subunit C